MPNLRATLSLYYFAYFGAMGVYFPYMPAWMQARGLSGLEASIITALTPVMSVLAPPLFGVLADTFGLRGTIVRFAAIGAVACLSVVTIGAYVGQVVGFAFLFACMLGFTFFRSPMGQLSDVLALEDAGDYARLRVWGSIGFMVAAPLTGSWVGLSPSWLLPLCATLGMLVVLVTSFQLPTRSTLPAAPSLHAARRLLQNRSFQLLLLVAALGQAAHTAYDLCITWHLRDLGASGTTTGAAWAIATAGEVVLMTGSAWFLRRFSLSWLLLVSLLAGSLRWAFLASSEDLSLIVGLQPLHGLSFGLRWVCSLLLVQRFARAGALATAQGLFLAAHSAGGAIGLVCWGGLYDVTSTRNIFAVASAVAAVAALGVVPLLRRVPRRVSTGAPSTAARAG